MHDGLLLALGQRVRLLRAERGLTQRELAEAIGLARTSVTNLEAGRQEIGLPVLLRLAAALGVTPGVLVDGLGGSTPAVMPWLELAHAVTAAERQHRAAADRAWDEHRYNDAIRERATADGLHEARELHARVVAAANGGGGRG
ncbi:helix-turn-helix domain-containing protein [Verrucosispora sp. TAA-831]|uniref:helix-turn-helix domain-containing protein n=1 Tax=Verrucosispora sp. TAA-831 TaxID=3422227 RepID=UPI003D6F1000